MSQREDRGKWKERTAGGRRRGEGWIESLRLANANWYMYRIDTQQSPTAQHRELHSISLINHMEKNMKIIIYV